MSADIPGVQLRVLSMLFLQMTVKSQTILTVVNLSRELKIQSVQYGAFVVGSMLGFNHCKKAVYQLEGAVDRFSQLEIQFYSVPPTQTPLPPSLTLLAPTHLFQ